MIQLLMFIGGLVLVFATTYDTLGWILAGAAVVLFVVQLLFVGLVFGTVKKNFDRFDKRWDQF